tara:strand:+ start:525 stop:689 length:165 start_codon:yes stop_codon:yes gene_type:complete
MTALNDMTVYEEVKRELQNNPKTRLINGVTGLISSNLNEAMALYLENLINEEIV